MNVGVCVCVIAAGCIKSDSALQQIDPPSSRHENTAMASARTGVCMCVRVSEIILVKEGFSFSVRVYGRECTSQLTLVANKL